MSDPPESGPHKPNEQSIIDLEEKLSFQQRQFDELSSVVLDQQRELDRVKRELAGLADLVHGVVERTGENLPHEKPPHY